MKLKKLHIENYGRFCNYDYNFTDGLNEFCWQNGFGKTTLASFIKAMFYGLPSYRANSKDFNDRIHFYPFGGGKFGGNLTFVMDGREYRIERFFDKRSDSGDSLKVFCGGAPYSGFGKDIGKSVFGLDKASFERTVFIDSEAIDFGTTGSISAKLNDCVDGGESENTFADAVERLEQAKKALIPARGSNGKIPETRQDIAELNAKIVNLKTISASLEGKYNELNSLNRQIRLAEERKAYDDRINLELSLWKTYDGYAEQAELRKAKLQRLCGEYPFGVPTERETDELKIISRELVKIKGAGSVTTWNDEKQARLDALKGKFASGAPSEETLELADRKTERLALMQSEVERSRGGDEKKLEEYGKKFASGVPDDKKLVECEKNFARLKEIDNQTGARMAAAVPEKKRGFKGLLAGVVAAVIAIIFGIVSLLLLDKVVGGVLAGVGAVLLAVCGILLFKTRPSGGVADEKLILLQSEKKAVTDQIYTVIAPLGYYSGNGVEYDYIAMKGDLSQYLALKDSAALSRAELESKKADILSLQSQLSAFFKQFGMEGDNFAYNGRTLRSDKSEFERLLAEQGEAAGNKRHAEQEYAKNLQAANAVLARYKMTCTGDLSAFADKLVADYAEIKRLQGEIAEWNIKAEDFKIKNNLAERPEQQKTDGDMDAKLAAFRKRLAVVENEIADSEAKVEKLDGLTASLEEKKERLENYLKRYALLDGTVTLLKKAEQNLKDKYISPVENSFLRYSDMIERALGEKVLMDSDFNIYFERGGEARSDRHLSSGQRSVCGLCFRLALIDNMYTEEKPFIIMDDPFVNVDDEHFEKTARLVKELACGKQIVYFCCHSSRSLNG